MIDLNFKAFLEMGLNEPGRAGQHFWKPETPLISDKPEITPAGKKTHLKGVHLNQGFRPMYPAPFKGVTAEKLGIKIKKIPKFKK